MNEFQSVTKSLSSRERIAAILWLVIGIGQVCSVIFCITGFWNIYASITRFKRANQVLTPWRGIVTTYDKELTGSIICIVVNLIFGGVIGIAGAIYDIVAVRGYVLKNNC